MNRSSARARSIARSPLALGRSFGLALALALGAGCTLAGDAPPAAAHAAPTDEAGAVDSRPAPSEPPAARSAAAAMDESSPARTELATFGAGCYWCVEAVYDQIDGVLAVRSGFMGGHVENPTYAQICTGTTGHAEVCELEFDPQRISYDELLGWFWRLHDPTTLNRQGADVGTQYRSAIFTHSDRQRADALASKATAQGAFRDPIVTEIVPAATFYPGPDEHQDYYVQNKSAGYCRMVIRPKLEKLDLEH